jgi:hypothetical protein
VTLHFAGQADGLRIDVSHSGVYDDRGGLNHTDNFACDRPRLPIGIILTHFTGGALTSVRSVVLTLHLSTLSVPILVSDLQKRLMALHHSARRTPLSAHEYHDTCHSRLQLALNMATCELTRKQSMLLTHDAALLTRRSLAQNETRSVERRAARHCDHHTWRCVRLCDANVRRLHPSRHLCGSLQLQCWRAGTPHVGAASREFNVGAVVRRIRVQPSTSYIIRVSERQRNEPGPPEWQEPRNRARAANRPYRHQCDIALRHCRQRVYRRIGSSRVRRGTSLFLLCCFD